MLILALYDTTVIERREKKGNTCVDHGREAVLDN